MDEKNITVSISCGDSIALTRSVYQHLDHAPVEITLMQKLIDEILEKVVVNSK